MGWFDFMKPRKGDETHTRKSSTPPGPAGPPQSLFLSLEQRLMFDAAAAATAAEVAGEAVAQEQADAAVSADGPGESPASDSSEGQEVVEALTTFLPEKSPAEIVFVDPTVPDYATLLAGIDPDIEVVMLDGGQDGMAQMADALSGRTGIDAIHIISHGEAGTLQLGTATLTAETMSGHYAEELATIRQALSEQADILVYGCDFAAGESGQEAVDCLAQLTGADVQASSDLTGHASLGGDWDLEIRTGAIEARIAIDVQEQTDWVSLLSAPQLDATKSPTLSSVVEDAGAPAGSVGTLVSSLVDFASPSGQVDNVTDADSGASLGIAITGANSTNGTWWYSTNNGSTWNALGAVNDGSARLLAADAGTRIYFQANANYNGSISDAITFHAWDQTSGTNGGTANLSDITTVRDEFTKGSYSDSDGTVNWSGSWEEIGEKDGTGSGMVVVNSYAGLSGNSLQIETDFLSRGASRQVDLSGATSATLSFDYIRQHGGGTNGEVSVEVYNGKAWTSLQTFSINATDASAQSVKVDISAYANADTQIRFIVSGSDALGRLHVDNIEVTATGIGGRGSAYSATGDTAALSVAAVNDAPVFVPHGLTYNTTEGAAPITSAVSVLIGTSVTDVDSGALSGVAIFGMTGSGGTLEYSLDGSTWSSVGSLSSSNALLLRSTDQVRFTPDRDNGGTIQVSYRAWDQTSGSAGSKVDVSVNGGATAFSSATDVVTCSIASVNDAPVLADTALTLTVAEDAGVPTGAVGSTVSTLTGGLTDVDSGAIKGLAIMGTNETNGTWYYTTNGGSTWTAVGSVSTTSALLLADNANTRLYFAPMADHNGTSAGAMTIRGWDQTSGTAGTKVSTASNGGTTAFSNATDTIDVTVTPVNDAPTDLSLSANTVAENAANGTVVGTVSGSDPDSGDTKTYSLTDSAGGRFAIHSGTGVITVADGSLLNYESAPSHTVTVRVTDSGGLTYDEIFTVAVTNVNEAPVAVDDRPGLRFDGVDDFVEMGSGAVYEVTDTVTMEAWINREPSPQASQIIINKEGEYEVGLDADGSLKWAFANTNPGWAWHDTGVVIPEHTWTHIAVTYDHGTITSYVDGVAVEVFAGSGTIGDAHPTKDTLRIGGRENNPANQYFAGQISDVQVWNTARTAGEIGSDLNGTLSGTETGLLGYWKFNENSGTNADNLTANSDGTLGGASPGQTPQWSTYRVSEDNTLTVAGPGVLANDADPDGDAVSAVMVTGPSHASSFTLNADGSFSYTPAADFSGTDSFTYRVSDGSSLSNIATVSIQVDPVNDAPTDLSLSANTVAENAANGTVVGTVSGTDPDGGDTKTYSFTDNAGGRFAINSGTGVITVANSTLLNYEAATSHAVTVRVTDASGLTYDENFTINLTDVNEATPTITSNGGGATASIRLNENITTVTTVTATDGDTRQTLTYSISGGADASKFTIDSNTGSLSFASAPNFEAPTDSGANNIYDVTVRVSDNNGGIDTQAIAVTVSNVNEAPTDLALSANTVVENAANGTVVGTITGTDVDAGDTKSYTFTNSAGGRFAINRTTGVITVANSTLLNYEAATSHAVTVRMTDRAGLTYDETFTINVTNVNEAPAGTNATVTINEDTAHTVTVANLGFSDVDAGDSLSAVRIDTVPTAGSLTLSGVAVTAGQVVSVADVTAGNLVFTPAADANGTGYARITFSVRDSNNAYDATPNTLTVNVTAVNDAPTDLALSANTVVENAANGTVVGTITGTDVDAGDTKSYTFTNSAGGRFAINRTTGVITVANSTLLNYEAATSHAVTVRMTDRAGLTYDETFTINVTNVNEAPAGTNATVTINEDTAHTVTVANLGFSDVDAGDSLSAVRIDTVPTAGSLTLSGVAVTAGQVVSVADVTAGNLVFTPAADANGTGYARITFSVRDSNNAYDATPNTLTVNVTAVNDAPVLVVNSGGTVAEGGTDTITASELAVSDLDNSAAQLRFSIGTGPAHGRLELTTAPGVAVSTFTQADIAANRVVYLHDGSETTSDNFTFTVSDGAGGALGSTTVTLTVTPVNDAPTITSNGGGSSAAINVAENVSAVTIVTGYDVDLPMQGLAYSISGGDDQALFTIDSATGAVHFTAPRDFEVATDANGDNVYVVEVRLTDSQGASVTQTLHVTVTDVAESRAPAALPPSLVPTTPPAAPTPTPVASPDTQAIAGPQVQPVSPGDRSAGAESGFRLASLSGRDAAFIPQDLRPVAASTHREGAGARADVESAPPPSPLSGEYAHGDAREEGRSPDALSELLFAKLDAVIEELEQAVLTDVDRQVYVTRIAAVAGVTFSVGFVAWALRSTAMVASLFATIPAWQILDPLPVLASHRRERSERQRAQAHVAQEEQAKYKGLQEILDQGGGKAHRSAEA